MEKEKNMVGQRELSNRDATQQVYFSTTKFQGKDCSVEGPHLLWTLRSCETTAMYKLCLGIGPKNHVTLKTEMDLVELAAVSFQLTHILCNCTACVCAFERNQVTNICVFHISTLFFLDLCSHEYLIPIQMSEHNTCKRKFDKHGS